MELCFLSTMPLVLIARQQVGRHGLKEGWKWTNPASLCLPTDITLDSHDDGELNPASPQADPVFSSLSCVFVPMPSHSPPFLAFLCPLNDPSVFPPQSLHCLPSMDIQHGSFSFRPHLPCHLLGEGYAQTSVERDAPPRAPGHSRHSTTLHFSCHPARTT